MRPFSYRQPTRIHFGEGMLGKIGPLVRTHGARCLLVTASESQMELSPLYRRVKRILAAAGVETVHFDGVIANPTTAVVEAGIQKAKDGEADVILALGGGSSIDTAKAIAIFAGLPEVDWPHWFLTWTDPSADYPLPASKVLPLIATTTTSGTGSQVTQAMVISDAAKGEKNCLFHPAAFPLEAVIDPELMLTLPARATAETGFDAFSHAFESYLSDRASEFTMRFAEEAMRLIGKTLPAVVARPDEIDLRSQMAWADTLAGISLANAGAGIPHPLSEIVGGIRPNLAHGACLASIYPAYLAFLSAKPNDKVSHLVSLMAKTAERRRPGHKDDLQRLGVSFLETIGLNRRLSEMSCTREDLARMERNPVLGALPWASREELVEVLRASF